MNVISLQGLHEQIARNRNCGEAALAWFRVARAAKWASLALIRQTYPATDQVGRVLIFNLKGNDYRLIVGVHYQSQTLYIKALLTHAEYSKKEWMKWS